MAQTHLDAQSYERNVRFVPALGHAVLDLLDPLPNETILDLGCGDGALTVDLAGRAGSVIGVDVSESMVAAAVAAGIDARVLDATELRSAIDDGSLPAGSFDAVFTNAVLHWIPEADAVVDAVFALLKPGGRFVGEFAAHANVSALGIALDAAVRLHGGPAIGNPWFAPTPAEYTELLVAGGFNVVSIERFERPTPLPTGAPGWISVFGGPFLDHVEESKREAVAATAVSLLEPWLKDTSGNWTADYRRLRFAAVKPE